MFGRSDTILMVINSPLLHLCNGAQSRRARQKFFVESGLECSYVADGG
jgi:hypothetical protein